MIPIKRQNIYCLDLDVAYSIYLKIPAYMW